jgi:hypothetical protein
VGTFPCCNRPRSSLRCPGSSGLFRPENVAVLHPNLILLLTRLSLVGPYLPYNTSVFHSPVSHRDHAVIHKHTSKYSSDTCKLQQTFPKAPYSPTAGLRLMRHSSRMAFICHAHVTSLQLSQTASYTRFKKVNNTSTSRNTTRNLSLYKR